MDVQVTRSPGLRLRVSPGRIKKDSLKLLQVLGLPGAELSILIVGESRMLGLNREFRGIDSSTDVLSFPLYELEPAMLPRLGKREYLPLGDIVICPVTARGNLKDKRPESLYREIRVLLIHGLLHLLGYVHEEGGLSQREMQKKENSLLNALEDMD